MAEMAKGGFVATVAATPVIPPAIVASGLMLPMLGDPDQLLEAGLAWFDVGDEVVEALNEFNTVVHTLGAEGWCGQDYEAFTRKADEFHRQMMTTMTMAYALGTVLILAAVMVLVACLFIFIIGLGMGIWAAAIYLAMATGVGFLGPVEALMASAATWGATVTANLMSFEATMTQTFAVGAGILAALLAADVGLQMTFGNESAAGDLVQASVLAAPTIAAGALAAILTAKLGKGMEGAGAPSWLHGLGGLVGWTGVDPVGAVTEPGDPSRW